jgi:hypothetical protein
MLLPVKQAQILPVLLMVVLILTRWPGLMPSNFSAVYGLVFCAGVYFGPGRRWILTLGAMALSDVILSVGYYHTSPFTWYMAANYMAYIGLIGLGKHFSHHAPLLKLIGGGLLGSLLFYFITNTASWLQNPEYVKSLGGWLQSLTIGTPGYPQTWEFFRNTLLSGGLFTALFAGAMKASEALEPKEQEQEEEEAKPVEGTPEEAKA